MSVINNSIFEELTTLFDDLKKIHHGEDKQQDSGDMNQNPQATQINVDKIITRIDEVLTNSSKDDTNYVKILAMKSSLLYEKAKLLLSLEDVHGCQKNLEEALEIISNYSENSQIVYLHLRLMNHLAYVISKQGDLVKSKDILDTITQNVSTSDIIVYRYIN